MPRLTVRAFAELMSMRAYEYDRILHEQKYPTQQPQMFRTPYYSPALSAIREYYRQGNDRAVLAAARQQIAQLRLDSRRDNNSRVLDAFEHGRQARRALTVLTNPRTSVSVGAVDLRLSLDLFGEERDNPRPIYYNCRTTELDVDVARLTLEIAHWVLERAGIQVPVRTLEYVDLTSNRVHRIGQRRQRTINRMRGAARVIEALWPTV